VIISRAIIAIIMANRRLSPSPTPDMLNLHERIPDRREPDRRQAPS
jgi:hypothetical protein